MFSDVELAIAKTAPTDTLDWLRSQHVILLQGMGSHRAADNAKILLKAHNVYVTKHDRWRRGKGVGIAVHKGLKPYTAGPPKLLHDLQLAHLQLRGLLPDPARSLHILACYLPWAGSAQLQLLDLTSRYASVQQFVDNLRACDPQAMIILAGDLNAKVGLDQALSINAVAAIVDRNAALAPGEQFHLQQLPQGQQQFKALDKSDASGKRLLDFCQATDLINLTGLTPNDSPARPSFIDQASAGKRIARIDHFLVSPAILPYITNHQVLQHYMGSDHRPLQLVLSLMARPAPRPTPTPDPPPQPTALSPCLKFIVASQNPDNINRYKQTLANPSTWERIHMLAANLDASADQLMSAFNNIVYDAAMAAGYRVRTVAGEQNSFVGPAQQQGSSRYKVWHDHTCKQLQQQIRAINVHTCSPAALAERERLHKIYKRRVQKLVRKHRFEQSRAQLAQWRSDRNSFWRSYRPDARRCPFAPASVAAHFSDKMNSYPAPASLDQPATRPQDIDITSNCPTVAEIVVALKKMHSHAAGVDGIPTALWKPWALPSSAHASQADTEPDQAVPEPEPDAEATAAVAAALHIVFERVSSTGVVPDEWHTCLLSPLYKGKGDSSDMSSYRPLSIPTVACRIWSSIMNQRLMKATSTILPDVMFGFLPGKSCSDPLFILRHIADMHKGKHGQIFAVAFMDLSGAYDSVCRELLFEKLKKKVGLADHTLGILRSLYHDTRCIV